MMYKLKPYFSLSKRDQKGCVFLIVILLLSAYLPNLFEHAIASNHRVVTKSIKKINTFNNLPIAQHKNPIHYTKIYDRDYHRNANTMNFNDWDSLSIFEKKEIWNLIQWRKQKGGHLTWRELVVKFDLTEEQARLIKKKINIDD